MFCSFVIITQRILCKTKARSHLLYLDISIHLEAECATEALTINVHCKPRARLLLVAELCQSYSFNA